MSWLKLKSMVNESVCRRRLETPGEYSFVHRSTSKEYRSKPEMLDALKADNKIWKGILDCKMVKEDIKSFEKKVKNQFSQTPFEDIDSESGNEEKNKSKKDNDKSEGDIENMEVDGDEISNGKAETKKLANGNHDTANGKEISRNDNENCTNNKLQEKKTTTNGSSDDTPSKKKGKDDDLDKTVPFVGSKVDEKVSEPEDDLDQTMPFDKKKEEMEEEKLNSVGSKRKKKPLAGPASKVKKQKTDDSQENTEVEDKYESVLKVNLKICDTHENLLDSKYAKGCHTEKNILVYNLDKSVTEESLIDYFKKFDGFENTRKIEYECDGILTKLIYIVTFTNAGDADDFVEVEDDPKNGVKAMGKVGIRKYVKDKHFQEMVSRGKVYERMINLIESKLDFATRKKSGLSEAFCASVRIRTNSKMDVTDEQLLDSLPEVVEEVEMYRHHGCVKDFLLIFDSEDSAQGYLKDTSKHNFESLPMNILLLSNIMTRMRFNKKAKNFKDDPKYVANDNGRRVAIPLMNSEDCTKKLDAYFRAKFPKFQVVHRCFIPQQGASDFPCNLYIATFKNSATATQAARVLDMDADIVQKPELMMLLSEYLELRGEALKREDEIKDKNVRTGDVIVEDDDHMELEWNVQGDRDVKKNNVSQGEMDEVVNEYKKKEVIDEKQKKESVEKEDEKMTINLDQKAVDDDEKRVVKKEKTKEVANEEKKVANGEKKIDNEDKMAAEEEKKNEVANKDVVNEDKKSELENEEIKQVVIDDEKKGVTKDKTTNDVVNEKKNKVVNTKENGGVKDDKKNVINGDHDKEKVNDKEKVENGKDKEVDKLNDEEVVDELKSKILNEQENEETLELVGGKKVALDSNECLDDTDTELFKSFVGCDGFKKKDKESDIEEYFSQNHEHVKQIWKRPAAGPTAKVYVKFRDIKAADNFFTLNYVKYTGRTIRPFRLHTMDKKIRDELAKILLAD